MRCALSHAASFARLLATGTLRWPGERATPARATPPESGEPAALGGGRRSQGVGRLIVVTGGAGFIGSNVVRALNDQGRSDVLVVDELERGRKLLNLADCEIADLLDKDHFLERLLSGHGDLADAVGPQQC